MEKTSHDIYAIVTDKIINLLDRGIIPWRKPWHGRGAPCNLLTMRPYRGINVLLLNMLGYKQNYFLSFNQVKAIGGSVKKNEKSQLVVFWKYLGKNNETATEETAEKKSRRVLRYYHVFNVEQCTGIPDRFIPPVPQNANDPITLCEQTVLGMPNRPDICHLDNEAYYVPTEDYVNMPDIEYFTKSEAYYATLFHELVHSTGHSSRLDRKGITEKTTYGTELYSTEELIAELGSCYLQSHTGAVYDQLANSAAYIQGWLKKLREDKRCIIYASNCAQKASDYILNIHPSDADADTSNISHTESVVS
jgi:antirestriction protein ArdC